MSTTDLSAYASTLDAIETALGAVGYTLVHGSLSSLPAPHYLIPDDITLPELVLPTGTVVVTGSLTVTGQVDFQQHGSPIVNLVVTGGCTLHLAYVDAFLCVGKTLTFGTLIADSNWSGGVFVGGDLRGHTLVIKDIGVEVDGTEHVERVADCEDEDAAKQVLPSLFVDDAPAPRSLFLALRDSGTPLAGAKKPAAKKPAVKAKKPAAKKPAAKAKKKPAAKKPGAKAKKKPAATKKPAKRR